MTATVVLHFQSTGTIPGRGEPIEMRGTSLTVGRGAENDLVLPDPEKTLSKRHCAIEDHNGNIIVVDMSTNGTFLNYGKLPLGNVATPLNDGDILTLGSYEIQVKIGAAESTAQILAEPMAEEKVTHGDAAVGGQAFDDLLDAPMGTGGVDFLDDLLGEEGGPKGPKSVAVEQLGEDGLLPPLGDEDPLAEPGSDPLEGQGASVAAHNPGTQDHFAAPTATKGSIPDDWDDDFFKPDEPDADPFAIPTPELTVKSVEDEELTNVPQKPDATLPSVVPAAASPPAAGEDAAARAYLKALGAADLGIADEDLPATLSRLGHVSRILIEGIREVLMTRSSIKSEFRIEQTMIRSGGNNPLKFSVSPEQAIEAIVRPSAKGYLDSIDAAEQAMQDIKSHEVATITGMEAALKGILAKLDPAKLEDKIKVSGGLGSVLKGKKARYWEIYEEMYAEIADQAENDFQELFAREFAKAYQEQLDKLK